MRRAALVLGFLVIASLPSSGSADVADTVAYRARPRDTLELVAAEFYGDRTRGTLVARASKITKPRALRPGERLRVPVPRHIVTQTGDSWASLAETYLGDPRRAELLAEHNRAPADDTLLPSGTSIVIPIVIPYTAEGRQTLASIASAVTGDAKLAGLIARYNFLDREVLEAGQAIQVPVVNVALAPTKVPPFDAEATGRRDRQRAAQTRAATAIPIAMQAWREGDLVAAAAALSPLELDLEFLPTRQAVDVSVLVGAMHVASGDHKLAQEAFRRALVRAPRHTLEAYVWSPKICAVWQESGGAIDPGGAATSKP